MTCHWITLYYHINIWASLTPPPPLRWLTPLILLSTSQCRLQQQRLKTVFPHTMDGDGGGGAVDPWYTTNGRIRDGKKSSSLGVGRPPSLLPLFRQGRWHAPLALHPQGDPAESEGARKQTLPWIDLRFLQCLATLNGAIARNRC